LYHYLPGDGDLSLKCVEELIYVAYVATYKCDHRDKFSMALVTTQVPSCTPVHANTNFSAGVEEMIN